jgi:CxxC motif-containing protein (DUF1111 family)
LNSSFIDMQNGIEHHPIYQTRTALMNAIMRMMRVRKPISAALGAAILMLGFAALGGGSGTNFGDPLPGLTPDLQARFVAGQANFEGTDTPQTGLGPVFNNTGCSQCHSTPVVGGGSTLTETRYGTLTNGVFDPLAQYGGSLMNSQGIGLFNGVNFVAEVVPQPPAVPNGPATIVAGRRTTPLFGLGLVGAVSDETFQHLANLEQFLSPDTAGRVNVVTEVVADGQDPQSIVGRFGWKCQHGSLFNFAGDAYLNEMGITTPLFPNENCPQDPAQGRLANCALLAANPGPAPTNDPDNTSVTQFTDFMTLLAPPPKLALTDQARSGARTFFAIGCANCHVPALQTGPNSIPQLDQVRFFPFSDFLLHDMGSLGDGIAQAGAGQTEMRTAPLWGVRVLTTFLHDGRATTLSQAILAHDGQGAAAAGGFSDLSAQQQANLIAFLNSL